MHLSGQRHVPIDQSNCNFPSQAVSGPLYTIYLEKNTKKITQYKLPNNIKYY